MHHTCISWNDGQSPRKIHLAPLTAFGIWEVVDKNNIERFSGRCGRSPYSDMVLRSRDWDHELNWDLIPQKVAQRGFFWRHFGTSGNIVESDPILNAVLLRIILDVLL